MSLIGFSTRGRGEPCTLNQSLLPRHIATQHRSAFSRGMLALDLPPLPTLPPLKSKC
jgi:hypothetical protein